MGYANAPIAIGWISGSLFAGNRYEASGDKVNLARKHLVEEVGMKTGDAARQRPMAIDKFWIAIDGGDEPLLQARADQIGHGPPPAGVDKRRHDCAFVVLVVMACSAGNDGFLVRRREVRIRPIGQQQIHHSRISEPGVVLERGLITVGPTDLHIRPMMIRSWAMRRWDSVSSRS